ncbi:hypothetical protein D3C81_1062180 [compost metagenome]
MSSVFRIATISWFSFSTISRGVLAGANTPNQVEISKPSSPSPLPASAMVGNSGNAAARPAVVTAKALSLPALILADADARLSKIRSVWPDSTDSCAGDAPL